MLLLCWICALLAPLGVAAGLDSMPDKTLGMPLYRIQGQSQYAAEFKLGNPPQTVLGLVDTGSPTLGFNTPHSNWCELPKAPCEKYGTYNNKTSSTAEFARPYYSNMLINHGTGDWIRDTLRLGGKAFPNVVFGQIDNYWSPFDPPRNHPSIFGLTPNCRPKRCDEPYRSAETLPQRLFRRGFLRNQVISIYLGPNDPQATGALLFGAVDRAKRAGKAVTIPFYDPTDLLHTNRAPNVVNYTSVALERKAGPSYGGHATQHFDVGRHPMATLDTGAMDWAMPTPAFRALKAYFGLRKRFPSVYVDAWHVDCRFREPQPDGATLVVGFADDELKVRIPVHRLVKEIKPGQCGISIGGCSGRFGCVWGNPFIQQVYSVWNFDDLTLSLSNVKFTDETDIVVA